ncbi:hypothetical protein [Parasphingorhabdus pacifica]
MRPQVQIQVTGRTIGILAMVVIVALLALAAVWLVGGPAHAILLALGMAVLVQGVRSLLTFQ